MFPPGYEELPEDFDWTFPDDGEWGRRFKFDFQFPEGLPEDVEGAVIIHYVAADSPADASGLEAGMMITEINGVPIEGVDAFVDTIKAMDPGDEVSLTVFHLGEENTTVIDIVLGEDPENPEQAYLGVSIAGGFFNYHFDEMDEDDSGLQERLPFLRNIYPRLPYLREMLPDIPWLENLPERLQELLSNTDV